MEIIVEENIMNKFVEIANMKDKTSDELLSDIVDEILEK